MAGNLLEAERFCCNLCKLPDSLLYMDIRMSLEMHTDSV